MLKTAAANHSHIDSIQDIVRGRNSVRGFLPEAVPAATIREIFELAQWSPSNCNTQPWRVYLLSGERKQRLADTLLAAVADGFKADIPYNNHLYPDLFKERQVEHVTTQQSALGIRREDSNARQQFFQANMTSFGAPHIALLYMPAFGNEREAGDIGIYSQTLMLTLSAYGLASCPQTSIGLFAEPIRNALDIPADLKLMYAVAFGYEDKNFSGSRLTQTRAAFDDVVTILE